MVDWGSHVYRIGSSKITLLDSAPETPDEYRRQIEPWLSAVFQSEHLSLLLGSGFTTAIASAAGVRSIGMDTIKFGCDLEDRVNTHAEKQAKALDRGKPNIEDQIRSAVALIEGLGIMGDKKAKEWSEAVDRVLGSFLKAVLQTEGGIRSVIEEGTPEGMLAEKLLVSFLLSFASRVVSRERLCLFTTNYDRLIEYGCDLVGLRTIDRFVGALSPIFRSSRIDVDLHYNPPGIRGEPRYLEGVVRFAKLHGSIDWRFEKSVLRRHNVPFGAPPDHQAIPSSPLDSVMIYPNPAKDVETLNHPYSELFRDFAAALCRPNSVLITYGYGFGDDHINRVIADMLALQSTHLVIISYDNASGRVQRFFEKVKRDVQVSLLVGPHFGHLQTLVEHYLPKPAIDQITWRKTDLLDRRGEGSVRNSGASVSAEGNKA